MAAYATTKYTTTGSYEDVLAAMVTKLNTLDSTNNPVILSGIQPIYGSTAVWVGYIIYD